MFKLFRTIRMSLLSEGKTKKYLLYGLAEILLVVLGILIALQIDNWNQAKQDRITEKNYYENIKRQLAEDRQVIEGNVFYNQKFLIQYQKAIQIINANDRNKTDTLGSTLLNLMKYSDIHRKGNFYESLVNSGEIKLLRNDQIKEGLQRLEETFIYINKLEDTHAEASLLYVIPNIVNNVDAYNQKVENPDQLFTFESLNLFTLFSNLMEEKHDVYQQALEKIDAIIQLIDQELGNE